MHTDTAVSYTSPQDTGFTQDYFRSALGRFPTGVTVVTTRSAISNEPVGLTVSSFNSVSLNPPMVLWSLSKTSSSLSHFMQTDRYVIHVLSAQQLALAKQFAYGSQPQRFQGCTPTTSPAGALMLDDAHVAAWFDCRCVARHEAGDHIVFIGQVEHCSRQLLQPLVYHAGDFDLTPSTEPLAQG